MTQLNYQNPPAAAVTSVLDSEVVGTDNTTTLQEIRRELMVPTESVSGQSPDTQIIYLLSSVLTELKNIRILLELDTVPGIAEDVADESADTTGIEDEDIGAGGIDEA